MNTKTFTTKTDAIGQLIIPALGEHATSHDLDGLADAVLDFDRDRQVFFQSVTTDEFWEAAHQHALKLDVHWNAAPEEYNALYEVYTPHTRAEDTVIASGYFKATEDENESLSALDSALEDEGMARGTQLTTTGDHESFDIYWLL